MATSNRGKPYQLQGALVNLDPRMCAHRWNREAIFGLDRWLPIGADASITEPGLLKALCLEKDHRYTVVLLGFGLDLGFG